MDVIESSDLGQFGVADYTAASDLAAWVNAKARRIAPCLATALPGTDLWAEARGILLRVVERLTQTEEWVASQTEGPRSITYRHLDGILFTAGEESELRTLCGSTTLRGLPLGSFPASSNLDRLFRGSL